MTKQNNSSTLLRVFEIAIALLQLFDIAIHAATNQLEFLRVASECDHSFMGGGSSIWRNAKGVLAAISAVGAYLILNLVFLAGEGLTGIPEQGSK